MENNKEGNILRPDFSQESEIASITKEAGLAAGQREKIKKQISEIQLRINKIREENK